MKRRWFAVRYEDSKELFAIVQSRVSTDIRLEQAMLWDELDIDVNPYDFEFKPMHNGTPSADCEGKWLKPAGDWIGFDLSSEAYYKILHRRG